MSVLELVTELDDLDVSDEQWRDVVGFEGLYEVSDVARVRRGQRLIARPVDHHGYRFVNLWRDGQHYVRRLHVLVLEAWDRPRPPGLHGCHGPHGIADNSIMNLRWDTRSGNMLDAVRAGTHVSAARVTCPLEHPLIEPNLRRAMATNGNRGCLACHRAREAVRYAMRTGRGADLQLIADRKFAAIMAGAA